MRSKYPFGEGRSLPHQKKKLREENKNEKFIKKVVNAQEAHYMNAVNMEAGKRASKKWGRMVAKAGRNEKFRNKLNTVLTDDYYKGSGDGTRENPYKGGEIGSYLHYTDPIINYNDKETKKTKKKKQNRTVPDSFL